MVRQGNITQISRDHTEVQDLLTSGVITAEEAEDMERQQRHYSCHWSGRFARAGAEQRCRSMPAMCSSYARDGLTQHVEDDEILRCVSANMPQQACDHLIALTLERGAVDNVTVIVVRYSPKRALTRMQTADAFRSSSMSADGTQADFPAASTVSGHAAQWHL